MLRRIIDASGKRPAAAVLRERQKRERKAKAPGRKMAVKVAGYTTQHHDIFMSFLG
jgi:hypothetical protein